MTTENTALAAFKQAFPVCIGQKVQWGEMDALQHLINPAAKNLMLSGK